MKYGDMDTPEAFTERVMNKVDADTAKDMAMGETIGKQLLEMMRAGVLDGPPKPDPLTFGEKSEHTDEERLAYYRSHGLTDCHDYPGGDSAFVADVLSGTEHDRKDHTGKEDLYVMERMADRRFKYRFDFAEYTVSYSVRAAVGRYADRHGMNSISSPGLTVRRRWVGIWI